MEILKKLKSNETLIQLFRYGIVGGIAFVVDYGSLYVLTEFCHCHYLVSAAIAFILGLIVNYLLSLKWVFTEQRFNNAWMEFAIFAIIGVIGLGLNELLIYAITEHIGLHYMIGKIISTVVVFFWNFFARKMVLFTSKK